MPALKIKNQTILAAYFYTFNSMCPKNYVRMCDFETFSISDPVRKKHKKLIRFFSVICLSGSSGLQNFGWYIMNRSNKKSYPWIFIVKVR